MPNAAPTDDFSDERVGERLKALVAEEQDGSLTALEVAGKMNVSITLAQEFLKVSGGGVGSRWWWWWGDDGSTHVQTAEAGEHLCRDESIHGLLFYPNRFAEFARTLEGR